MGRRSRSSSLDSLGRRRQRRRSRRDSRSPSPRRRRRDSRRSRSPSTSRPRSRRRDSRSRSRSIDRRKDRVHKSNHEKDTLGGKTDKEEKVEEQNSAFSHLSEEEQMKMLMGFGDFDSTKGKVVEDNVKGAAAGVANKEVKREYRQYMNRRGGFNKPLG